MSTRSFQHLGGYFVSFMSGNGTMLAVHLVRPGPADEAWRCWPCCSRVRRRVMGAR
jgi:uncharacterized membrane protein YoaK (UPF0700 family)